jgi:hypothetical protein
MTWTPNPNEPSAVFEEPVINNALAIITRDFAGGLKYFYPDQRLPDFKERSLGKAHKNEFPCVAITPRGNEIDEAEDGSHLVEVATFDIYLGVTGKDATTVTQLIMRYVRVMDAILRSARLDFFTGMSNPFEVVLQLNHSYGPVGDDETIYFRGAIVSVTLRLRER